MKWKCRDKNIEYGKGTLIMGIVNVTPDSFSDGGEHTENAAAYALELIGQGADIIDLGAQSTRPGAQEITADEEWARLDSTLTELRAKTDTPISVDTFYPEVAERALRAGADIINDVSGTFSEEMCELVKAYGCGYVVMHNGSESDEKIVDFFNSMIEKCGNFGIERSQLCVDVGIGFGKNYEENLKILANIGDYKLDDVPLLLGASRKSVIGIATGEQEPKCRLFGNVAVHTHAVMSGVDIIRLHDVKSEKQGIAMAQAMRKLIK